MTELQSFGTQQNSELPSDFKELFFKYFAFWPWFLLAISVTFSAAYLYLRYTPVLFTTNAKIKIIDKNDSSELSIALPGVFQKSNINLESEIAIFKSYRLTEEIVKALDLNITYFQEGMVKTIQQYNPPFKVEYKLNKESIISPLNFQITINDDGYTIKNTKTSAEIIMNNFWYDGQAENFPIQIKPQNDATIAALKGQQYFVNINSIKNTTSSYRNAIQITSDKGESNMLNLNLKGINSIQNEIILNTLITVYENDGIKDHQEVSKRTIAFVEDRLKYLLTELEIVEQNKKDYKTTNNISYLPGDAGVASEALSSKDQALFAMESQLVFSKDLKKSLFGSGSGRTEFELLPSNIGLESANVNALIDDFNNAVLMFDKFKTSAGENNPKLQQLRATLEDIKRTIIHSISGYMQQLQSKLQQSKKAQSIANVAFSTIPEKENILRKIEREQTLKENLYLVLLQKREEAAINLAVTAPNVKVIDYSITNPNKISPNNQQIYLIALCLGLFTPFGILYLAFLLNTKIVVKKDITTIAKDIPVLLEIPLFKELQTPEAMGAYINESEHLEETFRTLIYNTLFIQPSVVKAQGTAILISSAIPGEGKTFIATNLAKSLAKKGKKVLLLGGDLRNPKIHDFLNLEKKETGIVNYVIDPQLDMSQIITSFSQDTETFDVIFSGPIPPNPQTILSNPRFDALMVKLKSKYEYVIIDSAPTHLVADTLVFAAHADITVFVVRSKYTDKKLIEFSSQLAKEGKLKNMAYVVNGIEKTTSSYGYGYGYGYGKVVKNKKWYQFK